VNHFTTLSHFILTLNNTCSVAQVTESQYTPDRNSLSEEPGSIPGLAGRFMFEFQGRMPWD